MPIRSASSLPDMFVHLLAIASIIWVSSVSVSVPFGMFRRLAIRIIVLGCTLFALASVDADLLDQYGCEVLLKNNNLGTSGCLLL